MYSHSMPVPLLTIVCLITHSMPLTNYSMPGCVVVRAVRKLSQTAAAGRGLHLQPHRKTPNSISSTAYTAVLNFVIPRYLNLGTVPVRTGTGTSDLGTQTSDLIWYVVLYNKSKFSAVNLAANDD